jgi:hypothetical protein
MMMKVRLELGRTDDFPSGDPNRGYEFMAPLTEAGHIDAAEWKAQKDACLVRHFVNGETVESGRLARVGRGWRFEYGSHTHENEEPFFKLDQHLMRPGLYVSLIEHDGVRRPFKIASVAPMGQNPTDRRS